MSQQIVNIGEHPSDGSGDPIRTSFHKINENFTELYSTIGNVTVANGNIIGNTILSSVTSVAGKVGDVHLNVSDVSGAVSIGLVTNLVDTAVNQAYNDIVDGAPELMNTIKEVSNSINNDPNYSINLMTQLSYKLAKSGGAMIGPLYLQADPTGNLQAATKQYVDIFVNSNNANISTQLSSITSSLSTKETIANVELFVNAINANIQSITTSLTDKADKSLVYSKDEVDQLLINNISHNDWGVISDPIASYDDYGSI